MLRALLWDVDGTIAETEDDGHRVAFNLAFVEHGLPWSWDQARYGELLAIAGGVERLQHDLAGRPEAPVQRVAREALARQLHASKTAHYARIVSEGRIGSRPGVVRLMTEAAAAGLAQAIVTTTSRANVDALFPVLFGDDWRELFAAVVCAEDAPRKKPDPQAYAEALCRLGVGADETLAIEDSPNGLAATAALGIPCCVTRSVYFRAAEFPGAALVCASLDGPPMVDLATLAALQQHSIGTSHRGHAARQADAG